VNSNAPIINIAEMCGTSAAQIEKTYYHTTFDKMVSNAMADYTVKDGLLVMLIAFMLSNGFRMLIKIWILNITLNSLLGRQGSYCF